MLTFFYAAALLTAYGVGNECVSIILSEVLMLKE